MPPVIVRSRRRLEKVLMLFVVRRTGIWGGNATFIFGVLADTGSWLKQAETSWYQPQQRRSLRHNRCRCPSTHAFRHPTGLSSLPACVSSSSSPPSGGVWSELHICNPAQWDGAGLWGGQLRPSGSGKL